MLIALWIVTGLLAAAYFFAGGTKMLRPKQTIVTMLPWAEDFSTWQIKVIGALEFLGALGLILPGVTGIAPWLTVAAAFGLALVQVGAIVTHARRQEPFVINIVMLAAALLVAIGWLLVG
jgi:uncharacterized membrane protein